MVREGGRGQGELVSLASKFGRVGEWPGRRKVPDNRHENDKIAEGTEGAV